MGKKGERPKLPVEVSPQEFKTATLFISICSGALMPKMSEGKAKVDDSYHTRSTEKWVKKKDALMKDLPKSLINDEALKKLITPAAEAAADEIYEEYKATRDNTKNGSHTTKERKNTRTTDFGRR